MTQSLLWPHDSDPTLPESEFKKLYHFILTMRTILTEGFDEVHLNTTVNDLPYRRVLYDYRKVLQLQNTPSELHIRDRVIINSMVNFLKGVRDPFIR